MQIQRYERAVTESPSVTIEDHSLGVNLLGVLGEHLDKRNVQKNNERFVTDCSDFDDQLRDFEIDEMKKVGREADGAIQRAGDTIESIADTKSKGFATHELADRFQVYAASRREGLLNRLARHQVVQEAQVFDDTVNAMIESRGKSVYSDPDRLSEELDLASIDLEQLSAPNAKAAMLKIQETLSGHAVEGILDNDPEAAQEYIEQIKKHLTQDQVEKYHDKIGTEINRQTAATKRADKQAITEIQNDFVNRLDELTPAEIRESSLPPVGGGSKLFFLNLLKKEDEAEIKDEAAPYKTTNGATMARLLMDSADPDTPLLSATQILEYVGIDDGISITDAKGLINSSDTVKSPMFRNTEAALKAQFGYEGLTSGFGDRQLGSIYYNNALSEILVDQQESPLTGKELRDRMYEIAGPHLKEYSLHYGESSDMIDKKLELMGIRTSPALKIVPAVTETKKRKRWIPGKGWSK